MNQKYYKIKFALALLVLVIVFYGLHSQLFISSGIFNFNQVVTPKVELDALQLHRLGIDVDALEKDVTHLITSMNNAQQGNHFLLGMISGLIFLQPTAGLSVGLIKEGYDFTLNYKNDDLNKYYFLDAGIDTAFWFLGGFVGFYILNSFSKALRENNIQSPRDLIAHLGKKGLGKVRPKKINEEV